MPTRLHNPLRWTPSIRHELHLIRSNRPCGGSWPAAIAAIVVSVATAPARFVAAPIPAISPAMTPATADQPAPSTIPISGPLGLVDVVFPAVGVEPIAAAVLVGDSEPSGAIRIAMHRSPRGWTARLMMPESVGSGGLPIRIATTNRDGREQIGPLHHVECAPPPGHDTPDWAKGAVWYQVFVERFRNGNPSNDPRSPEFFQPRWMSHWETVTPDELELARARVAEEPIARSLPARRRGGQLLNVHSFRRYGGDLEGVTEKLDEIRDLGVTAIYLNPIFEAHSHHKYDASDHRHIDPSFAGSGRGAAEAAAVAKQTADPATWAETAADRYFRETFMPAVRDRELRLVLDGVWNHVGVRHWAFQDLVRRGVDSPYKDWFIARFATEKEFPNWRDEQLDVAPGRLVGWKSWGDRNGGLPEFARNTQTGRLRPEAERHVFDVTRRWTMLTDGWRLDVVPDMPMPFWRAWADHVRSINPEAALFCEVWFDAREYYSADGDSPRTKVFDGQMNYPFAFPALRWLAGEAEMPSDKLIAQLERVFNHSPAHDLVQMNLFGSHDTERLASMLANPGRDYDQLGSPASNPRYNDKRPSKDVYGRVVLGVALQALHAGAPMIYAGDEYGMFGADDPHCRKPVPWPDLGPTDDPADAHEPGLREQFRAWLTLRRDALIGPVLRYGACDYMPSGHPDLLVFARRLNGQIIVAALNRSADHEVTMPVEMVKGLVAHDAEQAADPSSIRPLSARMWITPDLSPNRR